MIIRTLKDIRDEVLVKLAEAGNTGNLKTDVDNVINQAHRWRAGGRKWPFMRWSTPQTFNLVANQRVYSIHPEVGLMEYVYNKSKKNYMVETPERNIESMGIFNTDKDLKYFRMGEVWPVMNQPVAATTLGVVSSSAADMGPTVTIKGQTSTGILSEVVTLAGAVVQTTTNSFSKILAITLSAATAGNITVNAGPGLVGVVIPAGTFGMQYKTIELLSSPTSTDEIEYLFYRQPFKLVSDYDVVDIPAPHGDILVWDTLLQLAGYIENISEASMGTWREAQSRAEAALEQEWLQPQSRGGQAKTIRYMRDSLYGQTS